MIELRVWVIFGRYKKTGLYAVFIIVVSFLLTRKMQINSTNIRKFNSYDSQVLLTRFTRFSSHPLFLCALE